MVIRIKNHARKESCRIDPDPDWSWTWSGMFGLVPNPYWSWSGLIQAQIKPHPCVSNMDQSETMNPDKISELNWLYTVIQYPGYSVDRELCNTCCELKEELLEGIPYMCSAFGCYYMVYAWSMDLFIITTPYPFM